MMKPYGRQRHSVLGLDGTKVGISFPVSHNKPIVHLSTSNWYIHSNPKTIIVYKFPLPTKSSITLPTSFGASRQCQ